MIVFGTISIFVGGLLLIGGLFTIFSDGDDVGSPVALIGLGLILFGLVGIAIGQSNAEKLERSSLVNQLNAVEVTSYVDVDRLMKNKVYVAKGDVIYVWEDGKLMVK